MIEIVSTSYQKRFDTRKPRNTKGKDYINNDMLYKAIVAWRESSQEKLSDELGGMIILLAKKIVNHRHFARYNQELKEEMVSDSIIALIKAIPKFDHIKYNNPFAYLTSVCFNANITVIKSHYRENAKHIRYFLDNTEVIDSSDGFTLNMIEQEKVYVESAKRAKEKISSYKTPKPKGPSLFDEDEFIKDIMESV